MAIYPKIGKVKRIGVVNPCGILPSLFPERLNRSRQYLEKKGYEVFLADSCFINKNGRPGSADRRANEINCFFRDDSIDAILCASGGLHSNEVLPLLDYESIKSTKKFFCGYSDVTLIHAALQSKSNLVTFYGPCLLTEFGEYPQPFVDTIKSFENSLCSKVLNLEKINSYTDSFIDWNTYKESRITQPNSIEVLREGIGEGNFVGGCLPSLIQLTGTTFDYDYENAILFLDIPEGEILGKGLSVQRVQMMITDLKNQGKLDKLQGMVLGKFYRQDILSERKILSHILDTCKNIPIVYGYNISHGDPQITIPIGVKCNLINGCVHFKY